MKLRQLAIENFRAVRSLQLDFQDALLKVRPMTVLAGPNGSGKTSVLFAIVQALRGEMGYRTDDVPEPSELDIHAAGDDDELRAAPVSAQVELQIQFEPPEQEAIRQVFVDTRELKAPDPLTLPALENGMVRAIWGYPPERQPDGSLTPAWHFRVVAPSGAWAWFKGRQFAVRGWRGRKLRDRSVLDRVGGLLLFPQDRNLRSRVIGDRRSAGPADPDADELLEPTVRSTERSVSDILAYLSNYSRTTPGLKEGENWEKRIQDGFARICAPKKYLSYRFKRNDPVGAPYFSDGPTRYPLALASSGEQVIIEYLTRLTHPSPLNHSLILIDEPEVHLHPAWIRQLYRALPHMGDDNQFIVTTHSPELRALAAEDGVLVDLGTLGG